jgi:hypothetical protein
MPAPDRSHAIDNIVVVLVENRSLDNVLGRLYGPEDGKDFDGVIGKDLSNPIPEWAQHGADRKVVPYTTRTGLPATEAAPRTAKAADTYAGATATETSLVRTPPAWRYPMTETTTMTASVPSVNAVNVLPATPHSSVNE